MFAAHPNNPLFAAACLGKGLLWLMRPELRPYVLMPLLINFLLYLLVLWLGYHFLGGWIDQLIPDNLVWLRWLLWPLFWLCFAIVGFFTFTVMANLLSAPFYGPLASQTALILHGQEEANPVAALPKLMLAEGRRLGYLLSRALPLLLLFAVPGVNLAAPFLWALFGAWGMALEYLAFPLENAGLLFPEQQRLAKTYRFGVLSFGGLTMVGLAMPVLNSLIAPAAVIGATIYAQTLLAAPSDGAVRS